MEKVTPTIGSSGNFELLEPFSTLIGKNTILKCESLKTINEMIAHNFPVLNRVYLNNGLTQIDYEEDLKNNEIIASFVNNNSYWYQIPVRYIKSPAKNDGVIYSHIVAGIDLGPVADSVNLEPIKNILQKEIFDSLGIVGQVKFLRLKKTTVSTTEHEKIEKVRRSKIDINENDNIKIQKLELENERLKVLVRELETLLQNKNT